MKKQFAVIGLGRFGAHVAETLYKSGSEVLGIDVDKIAVQKAAEFTGQAVVADATTEESLIELGLKDMDAIIVATGENLTISALIVLHLKELGTQEIIAKASSDDAAKILKKLGASRIVFPEKDMAIKTAKQLVYRNVVEFLPLGEGFSIQEFSAPKTFVGKSLQDLDIRNKFGVTIIAVKKPDDKVEIVEPGYILQEKDLLIAIGRDSDLAKIEELE